MRRRDPKPLFLRYLDRGDARALGRAYDLLAPELLALALHLTRRLDLAEDALQETFLRALENGHRFDRSRALAPWLVGILVNAVRKQSGQSYRTRRVGEATGDEIAPGLDPQAQAAASEIAELVGQEIGGLSEPYHEVVAAHLGEGLPPRDIAARLGRAPGTVRVQLHRGLEMLRERLTKRDPGADGVLGRMAAVGLVPAGAELSAAKVATLETVRGQVLSQAEVLVASGEVGAGAGAGASTTAVVAGGVALALAGALYGWTRLEDVTPAAATTVTARIAAEDIDLPPLPELTLDPAAEPRTRETQAPPPEAAPAPPRSAAMEATPSRRSRSPRSSARSKDARPEPIPVRVIPDVDTSALRSEYDPHATVRASARSAKGEPLGDTADRFSSFHHLALGNVRRVSELPDAMVVRFDHPDALPTEVNVLATAFRMEGPYLVARPRIRLEPVEDRLKVRLGSSVPFSGTLIAIRVSRLRGVRVDDVQTVAPGATGSVRLRLSRGTGTHHVVAVSADSTHVPTARRFKRKRGGVTTVPLAKFAPGPLQSTLRLRGPFGDEVPYERLAGALRDDARLYDEDNATSATFEFEGLTLIDLNAVKMADLVGGRSNRDSLPVAPLSVDVTPTGQGNTVSGILPGLYDLRATSPWYPFGELPVDQVHAGRKLRALGRELQHAEFDGRAPVAGIEAMLALEEDDLKAGRRAPTSAVLVIGSRSTTVPVRARPAGGGWRLRLLAPPLSPGLLRVHVGTRSYEGRIESTAPALTSGVILTLADGEDAR